jgi:hypothetical protein
MAAAELRRTPIAFLLRDSPLVLVVADPPRPVGRPARPRDRPLEDERPRASRVRRREQDGHRAALGDADQRGALGPGGVHDRANVVHAGLETRRAADAI